MTDSSGTLQNHIEYDGYGNIVAESNSSFGDRYKYTSREWDAEIDLQYNRARFYDPTIGRWISEDPIGFDAGDTNLQRYVNNAPTLGTDPSGLQINPVQTTPFTNNMYRHAAREQNYSDNAAAINAIATTARSFVTLGFYSDNWEVYSLPERYKNKGYYGAMIGNRVVLEAGLAIGTGGASYQGLRIKVLPN